MREVVERFVKQSFGENLGQDIADRASDVGMFPSSMICGMLRRTGSKALRRSSCRQGPEEDLFSSMAVLMKLTSNHQLSI